MGWISEGEPGLAHVYPEDDSVPHGFDEDCICGPTVEAVPREDGSNGWLYTHHSLDGREATEVPGMGDNEDEYGDAEVALPGVRLTWADVAYAALWPLRGAAEGVSNFCSILQETLAMHSNLINEKQSFARDAGLDIEALTRGEDG